MLGGAGTSHCNLRALNTHLRVTKIAKLYERPSAADEQGVLQLHVPVGHSLRATPKP